MLLQQFQKHFAEKFPFVQTKTKFLLAVSGGIDSVVMTNLFFQCNFDFAIAHCNFNLRNEESKRDEAFVKSLAEKYNKETFVKRFDTKDYAAENKISIQEAARELRYNWFKEVISQQLTVNGQRFLITAHHADDNIETALFFFLRGSGIRGLTGIPEFDKERKIIRPLLFATRENIVQYAKENNLSWVEDSSNASDKYTRNFLRNTFIPSLQEHIPNVKNNLLENIERFKQTEILYQQSIQLHKKKLIENKGNEIHIPVLKLQNVNPLDTIIWEIIKEYNFHPQQVDEVKKLFNAENSSYVQSQSHRIIKNRNWFIIAQNETNEAEFILIEEKDKQVNYKNGILSFETVSTVNYKLQTTNSIAQLDAKQIEFPLLLRKWRQGDYFYPLGMTKKKKLSRFFIDNKLSKTEKENVWVLEMNKKIIWIINHRIDERFKIIASTKEVLKISFNAAQKH